PGPLQVTSCTATRRSGARDACHCADPGCWVKLSWPRRIMLRRDHAAAFNGKRQTPMLKCKGVLPEQLAAPPVQRRHLGMIVSGDLLEIIYGRDHLRCHAVTLRRHSQKHLE